MFLNSRESFIANFHFHYGTEFIILAFTFVVSTFLWSKIMAASLLISVFLYCWMLKDYITQTRFLTLVECKWELLHKIYPEYFISIWFALISTHQVDSYKGLCFNKMCLVKIHFSAKLDTKKTFSLRKPRLLVLK